MRWEENEEIKLLWIMTGQLLTNCNLPFNQFRKNKIISKFSLTTKFHLSKSYQKKILPSSQSLFSSFVKCFGYWNICFGKYFLETLKPQAVDFLGRLNTHGKGYKFQSSISPVRWSVELGQIVKHTSLEGYEFKSYRLPVS